jgi:hypothetical protein
MQDRPWPKVNFEKSKKPNDVENRRPISMLGFNPVP